MGVNAGLRALEVKGVRYDVKPDTGDYRVDPRQTESLMGSEGAVGKQSTGAACFVACVAFLQEGVSASELTGVSDETVSLIYQDRTVIINKANFVGDKTVNGTENSIACRFEGRTGEEIF